jgi:hypothetical protein
LEVGVGVEVEVEFKVELELEIELDLEFVLELEFKLAEFVLLDRFVAPSTLDLELIWEFSFEFVAEFVAIEFKVLLLFWLVDDEFGARFWMELELLDLELEFVVEIELELKPETELELEKFSNLDNSTLLTTILELAPSPKSGFLWLIILNWIPEIGPTFQSWLSPPQQL